MKPAGQIVRIRDYYLAKVNVASHIMHDQLYRNCKGN